MGESTTIDSIQIEIQSNSTNAASGIDALATSLGNLKKQTISKTAIANLEQFSNVIKNFANVHGASNALRTLANSIEKLKSVGTVTSLTKSLTSLPTALSALEKVNLDGVAMKAQNLALAVAPLSNIKAGGLGSMVTAMGKLEKVTATLSKEGVIDNFAKKVEELDKVLGPFAAKMTTIQSAFKGLDTAVKHTNVSIKQANADVHVGIFNFSNLTNVLSSVVHVLQQVAQGFANIIDAASQWDGIAARFGRGFGTQAKDTYDWIQRLNEEMGINVQQFMQYSSIYATMLTGFGVANEDAGKMALGYAELTYDIWAGYNDIYRSFDEAAEAVRSAIAGEVEPIRRAGFTIVEATLEQTAANHGLEISLEKATEAQKSYLRYLTLVDQAHSQNLIGTYAKEMNTAEGLMRTLSQQLKSLGQAFGSLFIPLLVKALPYVQAFVELLTEGVYWLANLFGIEIQDISGTWDDYNSGMLKDATEAVKELKNASIGIDELNVISPPSASGGSGSGGSGGGAGGGFDGLDVDSLWDESIFDSVQSKVDGIKQKLSGMFDDWLPTIQTIGTALAGWGIAHLLGQMGEALQLGDAFAGKIQNIKKIAGSAIVIALQFKLMDDAFSDFMGEDGTILDYIEGVVIGAASTYLLYKQWGVGGLSIGLGVSAVVSLKSVIEEGGITDAESLAVALTGIAAGLGAVATGMSALSKAWATVKSSGVVVGIIEFFTAAKQMAPEVGWLAALFPKLSSALSTVGGAIGGLSAGTIGAIAAAVVALGSAVYFVVEHWQELKEAVGEFFDMQIEPKLDKIRGHFDKIKEALSPIGSLFAPIVKGVKEFLATHDPLKGIGTVFEWIGGIVTALATSGFGMLVDVALSSVENIVQVLSGVITTISGIFEVIIGIFTLDGEKIKEGAKSLGSGLGDIFLGFGGLLVDPFISAFENIGFWFGKIGDMLLGDTTISDWLSGMKKSITDFFTKTIPNFFTETIPTWWSNIRQGLDGLWENVTGWVDKLNPINLAKKLFGGGDDSDTVLGMTKKSMADAKEVLKQYGSDLSKSLSDGLDVGISASTIKNKLSTMWTNAKTWWDNKPKLSDYVPSIGDIKAKLSASWTVAKTWWDKTKGTLSTYTPSIGNIAGKLKTAWENAKTWWSKSRSNLSYTPSIGSIASKLSSAWTTAKNWWNKNRSSLSYTPSIGSIKDKLSSAWNTAKSWWKNNVGNLSTKLNISIPKISVDWGEVSALGKTFRYPKGFSLKYAAEGGIFDQGSLVWAGERGPEIVANAAGGKTGVMNVEQMQEAVYEGVYAAITAAMSGRTEGGTQAVNVYLDGKKLTAAVEKHQRERGVQIMGNEVYSY